MINSEFKLAFTRVPEPLSDDPAAIECKKKTKYTWVHNEEAIREFAVFHGLDKFSMRHIKKDELNEKDITDQAEIIETKLLEGGENDKGKTD